MKRASVDFRVGELFIGFLVRSGIAAANPF